MSVDGVITRDMAELPPSAQGQVTAASITPDAQARENGGGAAQQEQQQGSGAGGQGPVTEHETVADLRDKAAHGAAVYNFDADAPPEQKKAQALKGARDKLAPLSDKLRERHEGGAEVATDIGGRDVAPTVSINDVSKASAEESSKVDKAATGQTAMPGGLSQEVAAAIPEWYKVGWRAQNEAFLEAGGDLTEAKQRAFLAEFLDESYYGGWYHNAAIIFFAVFSSHFVTVFGLGKGWLIVILGICSTYYQTSIARVRYRARDDITREVAKQRLFTDVESVDWMNNFLSRFWLIYEPVLSAVIVASVDQTLSVSAPAGVDSMRMTHFTLGTKAPRIDFIRSHPGTEQDVVVMDWKISFTPNDTSDLTARQAADKVNPKVVLTIKFGKGKVVLSKDIVVEDVAFAGVMRIRLKLMSKFPHVQLVDLSFLEKPLIDFVAKPIGFDINMIPGLENFIDNQIHATLGPMMYDPNVFTINLEQLLSSAPIDTAIGVLQITVYNARGLKGVKLGGGNPDPYISFGLGNRTGLAKTKTKHSSVNPHWNESKFLLVNSLNDPLVMAVMDFNDHRKDSELGSAIFDLKTLNDDAEQEELTAPVMLGGKARGTVKFDLRFFPVIVPKKLADGSEEPLPESKTGVVRLILHQGKELDTRRSGSDCNPYARIYLRGQAIYKTPTFKRNHNPMWEAATEFLVTAKRDAVVGIKVMDNKGFAVDPTLGYVNVKLDDILAATARQQDWFPLSGCASGRVRMSATFKPVAMAGAINSAGDFRPPIGIVRIWIKKAIDLKNVESLTGGKSDPYIRVIRGGLVSARTLVFDNNLSPEFDEIVYVPVHNLSEVLVLEAMDYQHNTKDRPLGQTRLDVKSLASEGADKKEGPYVSTGPLQRSDKLVSDAGKSVKGTLVYEAKFYPALHLRGVAFAPPSSALEKVVPPKGEDDDDDHASIIETEDDAVTLDEAMQLPAGAESLARNGSVKRASVAAAEGSEIARSHTKNAMSTASIATAGTNATSQSVTEGITMSKEELLKSPSGVLVFNIVSGQLARKGARLEVLFDDGYWPSYSTEAARSTHNTWDEVGEAFIRELGYSRIILKLNAADKDSREDVQAIFRTSLGEFLEQCLDKPADFMLTDDQGGNRSMVTIAAKYVPVPITLEMRETVNNTGIVRVDLLDGSGLRSADRNGKSDPYCHFHLNGARVFKSSIQKKTLNPKWNEHFEVTVPSRVAAKFEVEVLDWDRVGTSDKLGRGTIDLVNMEPFQSTPRTVPLYDSDGKEHGSINVRLVFRPEFVSRARAATSTFVGGIAGGAASGVGGVVGGGAHLVGKGGKLAFGGATAVAGGAGHVGKGVLHGVRHVVPGMHSKKSESSGNEIIADDLADGYPVEDQERTLAQAQPVKAGGGVNGTIVHTPLGVGVPDFGTLQISVSEIQGLPEKDKAHLIIKAGNKVLERSHSIKGSSGPHDVFRMKTLPEALVLQLCLMEKKTLGKDKELGQTDLDVWQFIQPGSRNAAETSLSIGGADVTLNLAWTGLNDAPGTPARVSSSYGNPAASPNSPGSIKSRSRFSMIRRHRDD